LTTKRRINPAVRAGALLRTRREELGLTQADVVAQGGPSAMTLRGIENGTGAAPKAWTLASLERVLGLPRSTYDALLDGGDLPPMVDADVGETLRRQAAQLMSQADRAVRGHDIASVRSMRLPDDLWDKAVEEADAEARPVSALVRDALREYLEQHR
jgi:transcriptional regulator with XRE-family HTH domain